MMLNLKYSIKVKYNSKLERPKYSNVRRVIAFLKILDFTQNDIVCHTESCLFLSSNVLINTCSNLVIYIVLNMVPN